MKNFFSKTLLLLTFFSFNSFAGDICAPYKKFYKNDPHGTQVAPSRYSFDGLFGDIYFKEFDCSEGCLDTLISSAYIGKYFAATFNDGHEGIMLVTDIDEEDVKMYQSEMDQILKKLKLREACVYVRHDHWGHLGADFEDDFIFLSINKKTIKVFDIEESEILSLPAELPLDI